MGLFIKNGVTNITPLLNKKGNPVWRFQNNLSITHDTKSVYPHTVQVPIPGNPEYQICVECTLTAINGITGSRVH